LGLDEPLIGALAATVQKLRSEGREVLLVSSGAVAAGMTRLGWSRRPHILHRLQAAAAVGQSGLVQAYEVAFARHGVVTAQVLLSHADVRARDRYLNARSTLLTLLELGVVPIINENDTVVTDEIRFGDNDTLAALVANLTDADALVLLTDQAGLYDRDPRTVPSAQLIARAYSDDPALDAMVGEGGALGRGGMVTKLSAARLAARSGTQTLIMAGNDPAQLSALAAGMELGTWLEARQRPLAARKQWLAGLMRTDGVLELDDGAVRVLRDRGTSLLPVGVRRVTGDFRRGDVVACHDAQGRVVARGLVNYGSADMARIAGSASRDIEALLGYRGEDEVINRDNLVLV
jgi:glutamate 5-kinase